MDNKTIVINLFGEPSSGKSCSAGFIFTELKKRGYNIEYLQEFAKQKLYEDSKKVFSCEPYIFGKQLYRLQSVSDSADIIVTDSPILLPHFYEHNEYAKKILIDLELHYYNQFDNINYFLIRNHPYQTEGRFQTEEEAKVIHNNILKFLVDNNVSFLSILSSDINEIFIDNLIKIIEKRRNYDAK